MMTKIKKWTGNVCVKFANWQQQHWILSLFSVRLLAIWFSFIVTYAGERWHIITILESGKKQFTTPGLIITILLICFVTFGELSLRYVREKDTTKHDNGAAFMLRNLRDSTTSLCESKYNTLVNEIGRIKAKQNTPIPTIISNPEKQIDGLAKQISSCLCKLLQGDHGDKWRESDIFVSIAYEFPNDDPGKWHWATRERGLSLNDLLFSNSGRISTMAYRLQSYGNKTFFNSKEEAFQEKHYIPDPEDEYSPDKKLLGSIACFEDRIKKDDIEYVHFILTISTYDKRFVSINPSDYKSQEEADEAYRVSVDAVKYNLYKNIISDFLMRAKIEFCLLYLSQLKRK